MDKRDDDSHRYDDMLALPHHVSPTRRRMTMPERAAQFSPFAALTGYGDAIQETARLTDARLELGETERAELDAKLRILRERLPERPPLTVIRFVPDARKEGGRYETLSGALKRLLPEEGLLVLAGGISIPIADIADIDSPLFEGVEF